MTAGTAARGLRLGSPATAAVLGGLLLVLMAVDEPLARLAHQTVNASGGSVPVWISGATGAVGFVVAWRRPGNPLGWIFLLGGFFGTLSQDASFYIVADYRFHHGGLPLGWVAVLAQPGWAPSIALLGLVLPLRTPVAVAGATLAAAALFSPLRRRVQRVVDRRFNRARYDADRMIAAFSARLADATDLEAVRGDLQAAVRQAVEPAHTSVWLSGGRP